MSVRGMCGGSSLGPGGVQCVKLRVSWVAEAACFGTRAPRQLVCGVHRLRWPAPHAMLKLGVLTTGARRGCLFSLLPQQYQKLLDDVNPYSRTRWVFMVVTLLGYLVRTYLIQVGACAPRPPARAASGTPRRHCIGAQRLRHASTVAVAPGVAEVPLRQEALARATTAARWLAGRRHAARAHSPQLRCRLASASGHVLFDGGVQGWYIVTYALGIYLLNLLIAFLTPKIDPAIAQFEDGAPDWPT